MKKVILPLVFSFMLFSFTSNETIDNNEVIFECNQSYTFNGGWGCNYNGTSHGWCSQEEFNAWAATVYRDQPGCSMPKKSEDVPILEPAD